jgi:hypothetical protein
LGIEHFQKYCGRFFENAIDDLLWESGKIASGSKVLLAQNSTHADPSYFT